MKRSEAERKRRRWEAEREHRRRHPERRRARNLIQCRVRRGAMPPAPAFMCADMCGRVAHEYDHHLGYEHPEEVEPVCPKCHGAREKRRREEEGST